MASTTALVGVWRAVSSKVKGIVLEVVPSSKTIFPAAVILTSPDVMVERVRLPEVAETLEAPVPSIEKAPVENKSKVPVTSMSRFAPALISISPALVKSSSPDVTVIN